MTKGLLSRANSLDQHGSVSILGVPLSPSFRAAELRLTRNDRVKRDLLPATLQKFMETRHAASLRRNRIRLGNTSVVTPKFYRDTSVLTCSLLNGRSAMVPIAGWICQISRAYSAMVRSLEKIPTRATFRMALLAQ